MFDGMTHMTPLDQPTQAEVYDLESYLARTQGEDALVYDADWKPTMSRRAIRNGLVFCAVIYKVIGSVIGGVV
jgi:hypothetical protein